MLTTKNLFPLTLSSCAPAYSAIVTAPVIVTLTGMWSIGVYLLAGALSWLVGQSFAENTARDPERGTVYSWNRGTIAWLNGYALAATGIIATSGLAYVASVGILSLWGVQNTWGALAISAVLIALAQVLNQVSLKLTGLVQVISLFVHVVAAIALVVLMFVAGQVPVVHELSVPNLLKALLIAVFAFWGFDTAFALAEESEPGAPHTASRLSIIFMSITFVLVAAVIALYGVDAVTLHPLVVVAVSLSAIMALGSTLLPTIRGVESMAENHDLPNLFAHGLRAEVTTAVLALVFIGLALIHEGFFYDMIDCLSLFVGFYYSGAIFANYRATERVGQLILFLMMVAVTAGAGIYMLSPYYGNTSVGSISGVAVIAAVLAVAGAVLLGVNRAVSKNRV